jgi:ribonucleoside-triphosphate reductase
MGQKIYKGSEKLGWEDSIEPALRNGTLSVGFVGLAECLKLLTGKHHGESEHSLKIGLQIIQHLRDRMDNATKETGWNFSCFATPAESTAGKFVKCDQKDFGIVEGVTDRKYYTNSFHVPVYYPITAHEKMEIEGKFHSICNAGAISYVELDGDPSQNVSVIEKLVQYSRKCGIGYFSLNFELDTCPVCGFQGFINSNVCPNCGWIEGTDPK